VQIRVNASLAAFASNNVYVQWRCPADRPNVTTGMGTSSCQGSASVTLNLTVLLYDLTTNVRVQSSNAVIGYSSSTTVYSDDFCFPYGCYWSNYSFSYASGTLGGNLSWWINTTMNSGDAYEVLTSVSGTVGVTMQGFPGSNAVAALNYGTKGNEWNLTSIQVR
jgi:hypothetical protein